MRNMKFSLIMCTIGRVDVLINSIGSIIAQTYKDFELIIVDQNKDDSVSLVLNKFANDERIVHIRSEISGLSANRNLGLKHAKGDIIAFPDDDCEYLKNTLNDVLQLFEKNDVDIVTINIKDVVQERYFIKFHKTKKLDRYNYKPYGISIGIFICARKKEDIIFDELLGAGRYFGASEESDMLSNLIDKGYNAIYEGGTFVLHPISANTSSYASLVKRYKSYNLGFGAFYKKEIILRKKYRLCFIFTLGLLGRMIGSIMPIKKRELLKISFKYRVKGFKEYLIPSK